jgi:hypothetical protein
MLAMGGMAEGLIGAQIAITWFGLFLIGGLSLLAFATGNKWIHVTVLVLAIGFGVMLVPWEIPFRSLTAEDREDPDVVMWFGRFQSLAYVCYVVMAAVLANFIQYVVRKPVPERQVTGDTLPTDGG